MQREFSCLHCADRAVCIYLHFCTSCAEYRSLYRHRNALRYFFNNPQDRSALCRERWVGAGQIAQHALSMRSSAIEILTLQHNPSYRVPAVEYSSDSPSSLQFRTKRIMQNIFYTHNILFYFTNFTKYYWLIWTLHN